MLEKRLVEIPIASAPNLPEIYDLYHNKLELGNSVRALKKKIQSVQNILQLDELKGRKRVLRRLGFTSADDVVEMKGRVACEISSGDELLLTEMIFGGVFNNLEPAHCAALLSCFVFGEKVGTASGQTKVLTDSLKQKSSSRRISPVHFESCRRTLVGSLKSLTSPRLLSSRMNTSRVSRWR